MSHRYHTTIETEPATEPITKAEVKVQTVRDSAETTYDAQLDIYIEAARRSCERFCGRKLITQTIQMFMDAFPFTRNAPWQAGTFNTSVAEYQSRGKGGFIELPFGPAISITHVKAYDDSDSATTVTSTDYFESLTREIPRLTLRTGSSWPTVLRVSDGVEVQYVSGYGAASAVPASIKKGLLLHVQANWNNRGREELISEIPEQVIAHWEPYQIMGMP